MEMMFIFPHEGISPWLLMAALLAFGLGLAHSVLGERYILRRLLRRPDLPALFGSDDFTKRTLRFAWHLTTSRVVGCSRDDASARHRYRARRPAGSQRDRVSIRGRSARRIARAPPGLDRVHPDWHRGVAGDAPALITQVRSSIEGRRHSHLMITGRQWPATRIAGRPVSGHPPIARPSRSPLR